MERYLITGAQLGLIEAELKHGNTKSVLKTLREILNKQFLGNSPDTLEEDVKDFGRALYPTRDVMGKSKGVILERRDIIKPKIGHYTPVKVKHGVNETTLPIKEGGIFWMVNMGEGASFDVERQEDAEIISRLILLDKKLDKVLKNAR